MTKLTHSVGEAVINAAAVAKIRPEAENEDEYASWTCSVTPDGRVKVGPDQYDSPLGIQLSPGWVWETEDGLVLSSHARIAATCLAPDEAQRLAVAYAKSCTKTVQELPYEIRDPETYDLVGYARVDDQNNITRLG